MILAWHPLGAQLPLVAPDSLRLVIVAATAERVTPRGKVLATARDAHVRVCGPLGGVALYDPAGCRREAARLLAAADLLTPHAVGEQLDMFEVTP